MDSIKTNISSDPNERLQAILNKIQTIQSNVASINTEMESLRISIDQNEQTRLRLSSIKNIDIKDLTKRHKQLSKQYEQLTASKEMLSDLSMQYQSLQSQHIQVQQKLKSLQDAYQQYLNTMEEITKHTVLDNKYKIISEATSSTKGKPVYAIKDTMHQALQISNRLLNVMYDGEIELLPPIIDETSFTLPFRCGINTSDDIKTGSQSESTLLSLALSMSLASMLTHYNVFLLDECDGYLDTSMRDAFVTMLQDIMTTLKMDQMFIISHSIQPGQYDHIVHVIDISHD
jgi:DNA repair exonuclease SbcCD ATPase subunit